MHVITAYRKRVGELRHTFQRLLQLEGELYDARSDSWALQSNFTKTRASDLDDIHLQVETLQDEVDYLLDRLRKHKPPTPAS